MKRGKKVGNYNHPDQLFKQFICDHPKTPGQIRNEIYVKFKMWVSWNTINKRLDRLAISGDVDKRRVGRYNLYMNVKNGCETGNAGRKNP